MPHVTTTITCPSGTGIASLRRSRSRTSTKSGCMARFLAVVAKHLLAWPIMVEVASIAFGEVSTIRFLRCRVVRCGGGECGYRLFLLRSWGFSFVVLPLGSLCLLYLCSLTNAFFCEFDSESFGTLESGWAGGGDMTLDVCGQTPDISFHFLVFRAHHPWTEHG
ncbi:hypothetical protein LXL04_002113 [Taraxacum kok-saghyz]